VLLINKSRKYYAFGSWADLDKLLKQLFGVERRTGTDRLIQEVGVGSLNYHFAIWSAVQPVTTEEAFQLFAAYVAKDREKRTVRPTTALENFVKDLKENFSSWHESPCTGKFSADEGFMIIPLRKACVDVVYTIVRKLARKHGVSAYDPHAGKIFVKQRGEQRKLKA
jgi:hypothetical protein